MSGSPQPPLALHHSKPTTAGSCIRMARFLLDAGGTQNAEGYVETPMTGNRPNTALNWKEA